MTDIASVPKIAFTGGGTGGHIYPGLAVAFVLQKKTPCEIFWIGSEKGMDRSIVEKAGIGFFGIPSGKLRRSFSFKNFSDMFRVLSGYFAAKKILKKEKPDLLFSKGGFVSVPPVMAAASLGIPVFGHESDLTPGLATKLNLRKSEKLFLPYNDSLKFYRAKYKSRLEVSGNPVRVEFQNADRSRGRAFLGINNDDPVLLVLGGSSGSAEINGLIQESLPELVKVFFVVHQRGEIAGASESAKSAEPDRTLPPPQSRYRPFAFIHNEMPDVIAACDLVICRGGAGTLWECAALNKPMIIIPLRRGSRGDQVENAKIFEKAGAAVNLCDPSKEKILALALSLAADKVKRDAMSGIGVTGAADLIADKIIGRVRK